MPGDRIPLIRDGDGLDVDIENQHREATNGLLGMGVSPPMSLTWIGGSPFLGCGIPDNLAVFWTTSAISTAVVTGTTVSTAKLVLGSGPARRCVLDSSGNDIPDVNATDETIYNPVVMTTPIAINTAMFCICAFVNGVWRIISVHKCPT